MPENILELESEFDLFIFDVFGVLWDGAAMFPTALESMVELRKRGKTVVVMSNSANLAPVIEEEGAKRGYFKDVHYNRAISAGDIAHMVFANDERELRYYLYGKPIKDMFADSYYQQVETPEEADFIFLGFPRSSKENDETMPTCIDDFKADLEHFQSLKKPLVCSNPDKTALFAKHPKPIICEGSLADYYREIGGEAVYFGKPHTNIYEHLLQDYEIPRERILMIGDTLRTDIQGAKNAGIKSMLTLSGISYSEMLESGGTDIEAYAKEQGIVPDYYIKSL